MTKFSKEEYKKLQKMYERGGVFTDEVNQTLGIPPRPLHVQQQAKSTAKIKRYFYIVILAIIIVMAANIIYTDFHAKPTPERVERKGGKRT